MSDAESLTCQKLRHILRGCPPTRAGQNASMLKSVLRLVLLGALLTPALPAASQKRSKGPSPTGNRGGLSARVAPEYQARLRATPLAVRAQARALQSRIFEESAALRELRARAASARTDEAKRAAWSEHYRLLYGEMRRQAPALKGHIDLLEKIARSRFEPPVRRSEGIDAYGFDRAES